MNKEEKSITKVVKIKKKIKSILLFSVFVLTCLTPIIVVGDPAPPSPEASWQETSYHFTLDRVWDGDSNIINFSGSYAKTFVTKFSDYNGTDNTRTRETRTTYYEANYSVFNNKTIKGYVDITMELAGLT